MLQCDCKIVSQDKLGENYFLIELNCPGIVRQAKPGQFVTIRCPIPEAFFRRPFSITQLSKKSFFVLYKVVGPGTRFLSERKKGETLDVIGPLGEPFPFPKKDNDVIFISGGSGIASLNYLAQSMVRRRGALFYGAKNKNELVLLRRFRKLKWDVKIATDDGSQGFKGMVSELFLKSAGILKNANLVVYICGPMPMLKTLAEYFIKRKIKTYVSVETVMACGMDICQGCSIKKRGSVGYLKACSDGPVFDATRIEFN